MLAGEAAVGGGERGDLHGAESQAGDQRSGGKQDFVRVMAGERVRDQPDDRKCCAGEDAALTDRYCQVQLEPSLAGLMEADGAGSGGAPRGAAGFVADGVD